MSRQSSADSEDERLVSSPQLEPYQPYAIPFEECEMSEEICIFLFFPLFIFGFMCLWKFRPHNLFIESTEFSLSNSGDYYSTWNVDMKLETPTTCDNSVFSYYSPYCDVENYYHAFKGSIYEKDDKDDIVFVTISQVDPFDMGINENKTMRLRFNNSGYWEGHEAIKELEKELIHPYLHVVLRLDFQVKYYRKGSWNVWMANLLSGSIGQCWALMYEVDQREGKLVAAMENLCNY